MVDIATDASGVIFTKLSGKVCESCCTPPAGCDCGTEDGVSLCFDDDDIPAALIAIFTNVRDCDDDSLFSWNSVGICVCHDVSTVHITSYHTDECSISPPSGIEDIEYFTRDDNTLPLFDPDIVFFRVLTTIGGDQKTLFNTVLDGSNCIFDLVNDNLIGDCSGDNIGYGGECALVDCREAEGADDWETATGYSRLDVKVNLGWSFVCVLGHTSSAANEPESGGSWETYWVKIPSIA